MGNKQGCRARNKLEPKNKHQFRCDKSPGILMDVFLIMFSSIYIYVGCALLLGFKVAPSDLPWYVKYLTLVIGVLLFYLGWFLLTKSVDVKFEDENIEILKGLKKERINWNDVEYIQHIRISTKVYRLKYAQRKGPVYFFVRLPILQELFSRKKGIQQFNEWVNLRINRAKDHNVAAV